MRYHILYRRGRGSEYVKLAPGEHVGVYDRPEVESAIQFMLANAFVVGIALQLGVEQFNVVRVPNGTASLTAFQR